MSLYEIALQRAVERRTITEWHYDTDGTLHVTPWASDKTLRIPENSIEAFVLGMFVGEGSM